MKKKRIVLALNELKGTVRTIAITQSLMDSFVVFVLFFLVFILISVQWYWALVPFGFYLLIHLITTFKAVNLKNIEERVPLLYEQLRTVNDTVNLENEVVEELRQDVIKNLRHVRNSYFIRFGKLTTRLLTLVVCSFLIIFASAADVQFFDAKDVWHDLITPKQDIPFLINESLLELNGTDGLEDIYGNASIAELGYEQLNLQINPVESEIDISDVRPPDEQDFKSYAPPEVGEAVQGGVTYEESAVVKNNLKIVKNYFAGIAQG